MLDFDVVVTKKGNINDLREANKFTSHKESIMGLATAYHLGHSPIRTQEFKIEMLGIPTKCSVHFVRHSAVGQLHYVGTARSDRTENKDSEVHRNTPVNHMMILNAEHLIDMSRKRLCNTSDVDTVRIMHRIREEVRKVDPALARYMQPDCVYRGGMCWQLNGSCGMYPVVELK